MKPVLALQAQSTESSLERDLGFQLRALKLPIAVREFRFDPKRRWRFDFAWPTQRVALECEGGVWSGGRHTRGAGFVADCEKYNHAATQGWLVLRVTADHIKSGKAIDWLLSALAARRTA